MKDFVITRTRESVCDNNCEPIESLLEVLINELNLCMFDDFLNLFDFANECLNGLETSRLYRHISDYTKRLTNERKSLDYFVPMFDYSITKVSLTIDFKSNNIPKRKKRKNDYSNNAVPTKMHGRVLSQDPNPMHDYVSSVLESHDLQMCQTVYLSLVNHDYQKGHIYEDEVRRLAAKIDEMHKAIYAPRMVVKKQHNHNCQQFMGEMKNPKFITQSKG